MRTFDQNLRELQNFDREVGHVKLCQVMDNISLGGHCVLQTHISRFYILFADHHIRLQCYRKNIGPVSVVDCFLNFFFYFIFFFKFSFTSLSSFFTHIETNQSVGGAKTGVPGEKPPDTPASRTWLVSHMNSCKARTHIGEMIE